MRKSPIGKRRVLLTLTGAVVVALIIVAPAAISSAPKSTHSLSEATALTGRQLSLGGLGAIKSPVPDDVRSLMQSRGMQDQGTTHRLDVAPGMSVMVGKQADKAFAVLYSIDTGRATMVDAPIQSVAEHGLMVGQGSDGEPGGSFAAVVPDEVKVVEVIDSGGRVVSRVAPRHNIVFIKRDEAFVVAFTVAGEITQALVGDLSGQSAP